MTAVDMPPYHELLWPALQAVLELGGSASISEIVETVIKREGFSDAQQAVLHHDGPGTELGYRLAWARTYLKGMGLLTNSSRGVWALTEDGTALVTDPHDPHGRGRHRRPLLLRRDLIVVRAIPGVVRRSRLGTPRGIAEVPPALGNRQYRAPRITLMPVSGGCYLNS